MCSQNADIVQGHERNPGPLCPEVTGRAHISYAATTVPCQCPSPELIFKKQNVTKSSAGNEDENKEPGKSVPVPSLLCAPVPSCLLCPPVPLFPVCACSLSPVSERLFLPVSCPRLFIPVSCVHLFPRSPVSACSLGLLCVPEADLCRFSGVKSEPRSYLNVTNLSFFTASMRKTVVPTV